MIKEDFLHYLWKYKLFNFSKLKSANDENIQIINVGMHNRNSGPDFFNAQIIIEEQLWAGNVEIHIKSSDWYVHKHEKNNDYDNVILHVVWDNDMPIFRRNNSQVTVLILSNYVNENFILNYRKLFSQKQVWIHCENGIHNTNNFLWKHWKEQLYVERLHQKSTQIVDFLDASKNDWEAVLFKLLAKNFGLKVNQGAFMNMANSFNFSIVRKNRNNITQLEALFFGQSGMLEKEIQDNYYQNLQKEYQFLQVKYKIFPIYSNEVKFFRLRPNNFPTIRISQLVMLYVTHQNLFSKLMSIDTINDYYDLLCVSTSKYWETHFTFTNLSVKRKKPITKSFVDLLLINTIIPLKFVYQKSLGKLDEEKIIQLMLQLKPEKNAIIEKFNMLEVKSDNALETQALLQLKKEYCVRQKCLQCAIGNDLLRAIK